MISKFSKLKMRHLRKRVQWHIYTLGNMPAWRRPRYGYLVGFFLVSISFLAVLMRETWHLADFMPGIFLNFYIVLVAFMWGVGPSLFTLLLGLVVIDWLYIYPDGPIFHDWSFYRASFLITFALSGIVISLIVNQREVARLQAQLNNEKACEARRQLEDFLGLVSHELKTPLTGTQGNIQLAQRKLRRYEVELGEPEKVGCHHSRLATVQEVLDIALRQTEVQNRLINDLLDASRIYSQRLNMLKTHCDLIKIVREAVEEQRVMAPARTILLEHIHEVCIPVMVDADRITQVINNYLSNALKYAPVDKPVHVSIHMQGAKVKVLVRDEGPGLPEIEQERIWTRFYRVPAIHVQEDSGVPNVGLGVGLPICRGIIQEHQGETGVDSRPGEGATFWFTLPLK